MKPIITLKYEFQEGWTWYKSRQPFDFTAWCPGQPNHPDTEHCLHLYTYASAGCDFKWNDFDCNAFERILLEILPVILVTPTT